MARPPIRRRGTPPASAVSITRSASATMSASGPLVTSMPGSATPASALDALYELDLIVRDIDEIAAQDAVVGLAARVHAHRRTEPVLPRCLVHMAMHAEQRLALLDQPPHGHRADRPPQDVPGGHRGAQVLVENRRRVEAGVV